MYRGRLILKGNQQIIQSRYKRANTTTNTQEPKISVQGQGNNNYKTPQSKVSKEVNDVSEQIINKYKNVITGNLNQSKQVQVSTKNVNEQGQSSNRYGQRRLSRTSQTSGNQQNIGEVTPMPEQNLSKQSVYSRSRVRESISNKQAENKSTTQAVSSSESNQPGQNRYRRAQTTNTGYNKQPQTQKIQEITSSVVQQQPSKKSNNNNNKYSQSRVKETPPITNTPKNQLNTNQSKQTPNTVPPPPQNITQTPQIPKKRPNIIFLCLAKLFKTHQQNYNEIFVNSIKNYKQNKNGNMKNQLFVFSVKRFTKLIQNIDLKIKQKVLRVLLTFRKPQPQQPQSSLQPKKNIPNTKKPKQLQNKKRFLLTLIQKAYNDNLTHLFNKLRNNKQLAIINQQECKIFWNVYNSYERKMMKSVFEKIRKLSQMKNNRILVSAGSIWRLLAFIRKNNLKKSFSKLYNYNYKLTQKQTTNIPKTQSQNIKKTTSTPEPTKHLSILQKRKLKQSSISLSDQNKKHPSLKTEQSQDMSQPQKQARQTRKTLTNLQKITIKLQRQLQQHIKNNQQKLSNIQLRVQELKQLNKQFVYQIEFKNLKKEELEEFLRNMPIGINFNNGNVGAGIGVGGANVADGGNVLAENLEENLFESKYTNSNINSNQNTYVSSSSVERFCNLVKIYFSVLASQQQNIEHKFLRQLIQEPDGESKAHSDTHTLTHTYNYANNIQTWLVLFKNIQQKSQIQLYENLNQDQSQKIDFKLSRKTARTNIENQVNVLLGSVRNYIKEQYYWHCVRVSARNMQEQL